MVRPEHSRRFLYVGHFRHHDRHRNACRTSGTGGRVEREGAGARNEKSEHHRLNIWVGGVGGGVISLDLVRFVGFGSVHTE